MDREQMLITYVRPDISDILSIELLIKETLNDTFKKNNIDDCKEIESLVKEKISKLKKDIIEKDASYYFIIAKYSGRVIGISAFFPISDIIINNITSNNEEIEIGSVYIHPLYQKSGICKQLLALTVNRLKELNKKYYYLCAGFETSQRYWINIFGEPLYIIENVWGIGKHEFIWKNNL